MDVVLFDTQHSYDPFTFTAYHLPWRMFALSRADALRRWPPQRIRART